MAAEGGLWRGRNTAGGELVRAAVRVGVRVGVRAILGLGFDSMRWRHKLTPAPLTSHVCFCLSSSPFSEGWLKVVLGLEERFKSKRSSNCEPGLVHSAAGRMLASVSSS